MLHSSPGTGTAQCFRWRWCQCCCRSPEWCKIISWNANFMFIFSPKTEIWSWLLVLRELWIVLPTLLDASLGPCIFNLGIMFDGGYFIQGVWFFRSCHGHLWKWWFRLLITTLLQELKCQSYELYLLPFLTTIWPCELLESMANLWALSNDKFMISQWGNCFWSSEAELDLVE